MSSQLKYGILAGVLIVSMLLSYFTGFNNAQKRMEKAITVQVDTLIQIDTITQYKPKYVVKTQEKVELIQIRDTIRIRDTLYVALDRQKKVYEDSTYRAVVSGINPSLDEISVYQKQIYVDRTQTVIQKERSRWGLGVQIGYGIQIPDQNQGIKVAHSPYIGVGISYNLLSW